MYKNLNFIMPPPQLQKEVNFLSPALLCYDVCKQCRKDSYIGKNAKWKKTTKPFNGWNAYAEAWWTPCLTTTLFSIGKTVLRPGHILCPPKVFIDMKEEVLSLIGQNFSGTKKELLLSNLSSIPQQTCYVTLPAPDWCPNQILHKKKKRLIEIFGAVIFDKEIRFAIICHSCGHVWFVAETLPESTSSTDGIFIINSISSKIKVVCKKCKQGDEITILKRLFFYG